MFRTAVAVFDLDGTLVDSLDDIATHLNAALASRGLAVHTRTEIRQWVGHGAEHLVRCAVSDPELVPGVLAGYHERYRARPVISAHLYPGIDAALDAIWRHSSTVRGAARRMAVLSNKPHEPTVSTAAALLGRWPLAAVAGQRPGGPRKPEAAAARAVLDELGCAPEHSVMIGDTEVDVATARNAGMRSIAVTWGFRGREALRDAEIIVDSPAELAALFR